MLTYKELLESIEYSENHLLIANGFNRGLGINTSYSSIFKKMIEDKAIYKDAELLFIECGYDLENFLGKLEEYITNPFVIKYVKNNIKLDFMRATHKIVKSEIKNIYAEKNEGVFMLLKNFTNFFTLNYDSFLYILLLKHNSINYEKNCLALLPTLDFIEQDNNIKSADIYTEIRNARENGELNISIGKGNTTKKMLGKLPKTHFTAEIKTYAKEHNKSWKDKDIKNVVNIILQEEVRNKVLDDIDDGYKQLSLFNDNIEYIYTNRETQNLFFLHGAFHLFKDGKIFKKITQHTDKALYDKLEDVLNNEEQEIVCVFQHTNKLDVINQNDYLSNCLSKLEQLNGNIVIIGSSLAENDNHIFSRINNSNVQNIYISSLDKEEENMQEKARILFPDKNVVLFSAESISYENPCKN